MRVIEGQDVNEMYWRGMQMLRVEGRKEDSRNGPVLVMPTPVTSVYKKPQQRVILDQRRKANPFFHLYESLWMLAGRDDVAALNRYITDFGTRFAERDGRIHGAYGHRWRKAIGFDQLSAIVERLKANPRDRQAVLQMWDANDGHVLTNNWQAPLSNDLRGDWKDRPCNTHVYFRIRNEPLGQEQTEDFLDMLVSCRSNDIIFGAYGANAVHFSVLQEYMAGRIGCSIGTMTQMSFNYHAYSTIFEMMQPVNILETYQGHGLTTIPIGKQWGMWDTDLYEFMEWHDVLVKTGENTVRNYANSWFAHTATPMFLAHFKFKSAMPEDAKRTALSIDALDWRYACVQWLKQRNDARSR
jgi:thymidylate synthase